jgi:hypothetical protein
VSGPSLSQLQRWLQAVITHPAGVEGGIASDAARELLDLAPDEAERVVTRSRRLSAVERLAVYHNAYFARLLECLREEFPVFRATAGEEAFDDFALGYLETYPSRSYTLNRLAENFPRYLAETRPPGDGLDWCDLLIDLAALEQTVNDVFDGPGLETEPPLDPSRLAAVPPEQWADARLTPAPCLRLLTLRFPLHRYYTAVRQGHDGPPPEPALTHLAFGRREYVVRHLELSPTEFRILSGLVEGLSVGEAIARAVPEPDDDLAARLGESFRRWTAEGFFRAVVPAGESA